MTAAQRQCPYGQSERHRQHDEPPLRETAFSGRRFVLTTPNEDGVVRRLAGKDERIYERLDDGADVDAIAQAVREAARAWPTR